MGLKLHSKCILQLSKNKFKKSDKLFEKKDIVY